MCSIDVTQVSMSANEHTGGVCRFTYSVSEMSPIHFGLTALICGSSCSRTCSIPQMYIISIDIHHLDSQPSHRVTSNNIKAVHAVSLHFATVQHRRCVPQ